MATADANINWGNLDDEEDFKNLSQKVQDAHSRNFVVEFDSKEANCAFDLREEGIKSLLEQRLQSQNHEPFKTRWINIWMPDKQPDVINHIAHHYGFSPRLKSSMRCQHHKPVPIPSQPQHRTAREVMHGVPGRSKHYDATKLADLHNDPEDQGSSPLATAKATTFDVNHYRIVSEVWHFASIDWGYKFTCIGYNSLYRSARNLTDPKQAKSEKPAGKRVWTWLVLCNDHTLISIHENPFPFEEVPPSQYTLSIRNNLVNVFKQLSKSSVHESHNPIMTVNIRQGLHGHEGDESQVSEDSGPSLLFYYLFDDWYTSYALVARYDHQYGKYLENIRDDMFVSPNLESARHLHHFGRQLAVLKRIYESYTMIIDRLLKGPQASFRGAPVIDDLRRFGHVATGAPTSSTNAVRGTGFAYGVPVSTAAAVRFERLRDRISLYALSEIDDCLAEKEALVMLNFNLVALKESNFVERLTRITILLAKVTILFLPVSLLSAYFAIPIVGFGDSYTLTNYWVSFVVVFVVSLIVLVLFGHISGTEEGKPIYKSLTKTALEISRRPVNKKKSELHELNA